MPTPTVATLLGYEFSKDLLVTLGGPTGSPSANSGALFTVGNSGVSTCNPLIGFDVSTRGQAYASLNVNPTCATTGLYKLNLSSGAVTFAGSIGGGAQIRDIAVELSYLLYLPLIQR